MINAYCIFDTATGIYQRPFFCSADGEAKRMFVDLVAEKEHPVGKHPEDYAVFSIGRFDDNNGTMLADDRQVLITGMDVMAMEKNENVS